MALNAYLRLKGAKQGLIKGSVTIAGREESILVLALDHEVISPRDAASGLPTGNRQHKPLTIIKEVDRASPLLLAALCQNENITEWRLDLWRPSLAGKEVQFYTIELANAAIGAIRTEMLNNAYPENSGVKERERITFYYERITWTHQDGGITAMDTWSPTVTK